jgi:hypothetical protein
LKQVALNALQGVGDKSLGQWYEVGKYAYHVRRRLTTKEDYMGVVDIRGTLEAKERAAPVMVALALHPNLEAVAKLIEQELYAGR